ncbi:hypothetical protein GF351_01700 [Candidatus Woesearchaeota archaeon]|nr:hypothetical protein [Candidatus Woesearchaeota archaeon]
MNKKGLELSINFIVVLILSIVIFVFGIMLFRMMFSEAETYEEKLSAEMEAKIMQYMQSSGQRVVIPINTREVGAGDSVFFGVGVTNVDPQAQSNDFYLTISSNKAYRDDKTAIPYDADTWPEFSKSTAPVTIANNDNEIISFPVGIPQGIADGTYIIDVTVNCDGCSDPTYGKGKIYVIVT